ncbi:hypothetical protein ACFOLJ_30925 [Rugamonas sp. CCM 8940]|uniref:hypothetical protein n=1 Tax=Rugamonas sp. CCM 8940 TaxID=2765359 RepID=UPI0018F51857|nr:hypothetical protein [Rugamonas sp. CCM 8940]MBJ7309233.1 hypothetical protein [Rugamonas sp. CCM 8940]
MLLAIYLGAAMLILCKGLFFTINHMGRHTTLRSRLAWLLLTTAALDVVISPAFDRTPSPSLGGVALVVALACYVLPPRRAQSINDRKDVP